MYKSNTENYLNLGCGTRYHPDWINIDIHPISPDIIAHDLTKGIPLADASCDVVYHSNILEHFRHRDALPFMKECYRVLRPDGILRVAVPDLEVICRLYLEKLEGALKGDAASSHDYGWIMLEMYDQSVREKGGGEMLGYLRQDPLPNEAFIYLRIGEEGRNIINALRAQKDALYKQKDEGPKETEGLQKSFGAYMEKSYKRLSILKNAIKKRLLAFMLGADGLLSLEIGRFRMAGEVHHWMYDRYSLAQLMLAAGFKYPIVQSATRSFIPQWSRFNLDALSDGTVHKPDSLFMEAIKSEEESDE